nr:CDC27 family protein [Campylobacter sp.]
DTASENFQEIPEQNIINLDEQKRQKPKITIKTKDISSTNDALKDKFKQTKDINSALNLARNYFEKREYTQALNWAMAANELDKNNKESWVIFAKAKYYLGQKQDALVALREFNSDKNLKDITLLIRKMQNGSL